MKYLARKYGNITQPLKDHLEGVANLCKEYCEIENYKDMAYYLGLYHDIGKYSQKFQNKLNNPNPYSSSYNHTAAGAIIMQALKANILAFCIQGHHIGLQDNLDELNRQDKRLENKQLLQEVIESSDYKAKFQSLPDIKMPKIQEPRVITKYLFSCLVDADYTNSAIACNNYNTINYKNDFQGALDVLDNYINNIPQDTLVKKERTKLQQQVFENKAEADIYTLNMPTGSGKSLCSLKFALQQVINNKMDRIIYVIPYTSIIQQTHKLFKDIIGNYVTIVQCHSNDIDEYMDEDYWKNNANAKAKWDCPLIITTNVQFFNTIYSNKPRHLRRLHNIYNSFIVFDEIHSMVGKHIIDCLRGIDLICKELNNKALLMSATLPNFSDCFKMSKNVDITPQGNIDLFYNKTFMQKTFNTTDELVDNIVQYNNCLVICNRKASSREIYFKVKKKTNVPVYYLSTYLTLNDRTRIIKEIKEAIKKQCIVISTSLIEVGVDIDFQNVFREINGLDNIYQAAGRCNREGNYNNANVVIFTLPDTKNDKANWTKKCFTKYENHNERINNYYEEHLYPLSQQKEITIAGIKDITAKDPKFETISKNFQLIEEKGHMVIIPDDAIKDNIQNAKLKDLRLYTVLISKEEQENIANKLKSYKNNIYILNDINDYDKNSGIIF